GRRPGEGGGRTLGGGRADDGVPAAPPEKHRAAPTRPGAVRRAGNRVRPTVPVVCDRAHDHNGERAGNRRAERGGGRPAGVAGRRGGDATAPGQIGRAHV